MNQRALSLDALRGYAIITMILSGQIILTHLPPWMAHAQVPPGKGFDPSIFGISWVDLVFPFFLFAMGAAFPFSLGKKIEKGVNKLSLCKDALIRGAQLVFFAIFFQHMKPSVISSPQSIQSCLLSLAAFALMFPMFMNLSIPALKNTKYDSAGSWLIKIVAFIIGFVAMNNIEYTGKSSPNFDPYFSDIILIVLANMAIVGSIIYIYTWENPIHRLAILPFVMAIFLAAGNEGWVKEFFNYSPIPWAYKFYYLKYLFIVIPGSIAGEYLYQWIKQKEQIGRRNNIQAYLVASLSMALIVSNVICLYARLLMLNLALTSILLISLYLVLKMTRNNFSILWKQVFVAGAYCLLLGLVLEAYEGGIRKDYSTYSYYFVCSGLAFFALMFFSVVCDYFQCVKSTKFLVMAGQNPMIAYVATSMLVMPILFITHISDYFSIFNNGAYMGFLRGLILTSLAVMVTMFFTRIKWFWRT